MTGIYRDIRYAIRALVRSPGFSLVGIATLALGIGGATAVFSLANGIILKSLPSGQVVGEAFYAGPLPEPIADEAHG